MTAHGALLFIWIGFLVFGVAGASAVLLWAVRSGQFGDQEHARTLPLISGIPDEKREKHLGEPKR
jgi:nitrogen fixation-related uncharacterized protein